MLVSSTSLRPILIPYLFFSLLYDRLRSPVKRQLFFSLALLGRRGEAAKALREFLIIPFCNFPDTLVNFL